jgi:hypothetical protein
MKTQMPNPFLVMGDPSGGLFWIPNV